MYANRIENKKEGKVTQPKKKKKVKIAPIPDFLDRWEDTPKRSRKRTKKMVEGEEQDKRLAFVDPPKKRRRKK